MTTFLITLFFLAAFYFYPSILAFKNKKQNKRAILILNLFLGWTVLGWFVAFIWSSMKDDKNYY